MALDRLISTKELAEILGVPIATLHQWRYAKTGPPGLRVGKHVRYRERDVEAWLEKQADPQTAA